jgi:hypothetical protein
MRRVAIFALAFEDVDGHGGEDDGEGHQRAEGEHGRDEGVEQAGELLVEPAQCLAVLVGGDRVETGDGAADGVPVDAGLKAQQG